jgi:hypothetical protein
MKVFSKVVSVFLATLLSVNMASVFAEDAQPQAETVVAQVVLWAERRAQGEPYPLRLLLSEAVLRFDGGKDEDDFLLLDRSSKTLYNVVRADQSVMQVAYVPVAVDDALAGAIRLEQSLESMQGAPKVEGLVPLKLTLKANGDVCRTSVVVPELFPEIVTALQEFATAMASFHAANLPSADSENLNACSFADAILAPTRSLESGFPVQENQSTGVQRMLFSLEEDAELPAALFAPPADYSSKSFSVAR